MQVIDQLLVTDLHGDGVLFLWLESRRRGRREDPLNGLEIGLWGWRELEALDFDRAPRHQITQRGLFGVGQGIEFGRERVDVGLCVCRHGSKTAS